MRCVLAALFVAAAALDAHAQSPPTPNYTPSYYAASNSTAPRNATPTYNPNAIGGTAFSPPPAHVPQTAQPLLAMQPPAPAPSMPGAASTLDGQSPTAPPATGETPYYTTPTPPPAATSTPAPYTRMGPYTPVYTPMAPPATIYTPLPPPVPTYPPPIWRPRSDRPPLPDMAYEVTSRFWFRTDVLLWWTKSDPMPQPLVTTGSPSDSLPGALGQPGTQVVYGGNSINFGPTSGLRLDTGFWLDGDRVFGIEAGYFFLGRQYRDFSAASDDFGNPVIARPTIDAQSGTEGSYVDSLPGYITGAVDVITRSQLQGANLDGALNLLQTDSLRLDGLLGFRYLSLVESLDVNDQYAEVSRGSLTFGGGPVRLSDTLSDFDGFRVTNSFYGGSLGARLYLSRGRWLITALGKLALGTVQQQAIVSGSTTLTNWNGNQTTLPGGILATTANMGTHYQSPFAVAPEARFDLGYQITPWLTARIGYSFLFLSNVARPGNQVNRVTSANLVPSDPSYGTAGPNQPAFQFHTSSYWAQGMNFGLDLRF